MLAFYPVSLLLVSLARHVLQSPETLDVVQLALQSYYPVSQDFLLRNLEASSRLFALVLPLLRLSQSQGPFHVSVSFLVFVYVEAFVLLGGAHLAAEAMRERASSPGAARPAAAG